MISSDKRIQEASGLDIARGLASGMLPMPPMQKIMPFTPGALERGHVEIFARPEKRFYNPMNIVHGGWMMTMLDTAMGITALTTLNPGEIYSSYETSVKFLRSLTESNENIRIIGRLINRGSKLIAVEGSIFLPNGKICAHGTSTCVVLKANQKEE